MLEKEHSKSRSKTDETPKKHRSRSKPEEVKPEETKQSQNAVAYQVNMQPVVQQQAPAPILQLQNQIVCENCNQGAQTYCPNCDLLLCMTCHKQIHANPALASHQLVASNLIQLFTKQCPLHNKRCKLVCLSCNTFICDTCKLQLHSGIQHQVFTIQDAFYQRIGQLQQLLSSRLTSKQSEITSSLFKYQQLEQQVSQNEDQIIIKIRQEAENLIQTVKRTRAQKLAQLQPDKTKLEWLDGQINVLGSQLNQVQSQPFEQIINSPNQINQFGFNQTLNQNNNNNIFAYLNTIEQQIKSLAAENPELYQKSAQGFDTSIPDLLLQQKVNIENQNIMQLKSQQVSILEQQLNKTTQNYQAELQKWIQLSDSYAQTIKNHYLCCAFCGQKMSKNNANQNCEMNREIEKGSLEAAQRAEILIEKDGEICVEDAVKAVGNNLHFWVQGE
ncbi:Conserved_hypothetical protein [Hexamita inflata]|uniref:B box-type domain-containing protein n=1 Tax=Hexamita inflata TaxID=28002 RepID=A0AA86R0H4_9EUKA|nr:Conserved hypothetical protein [Hexamita inflata]